MSETIQVALISGLCVAIPSVFTQLMANRNNTKLMEYRMKKLEEKVDKHNQVVERTFKLEEKVDGISYRIGELENDK